MNKIILVADSTCDLNETIIKERDIRIIPLYVSFDDDMYKDGIDITVPELYEKVNLYKKLPKTSAISPGDFITFFEPIIEQGYDIIYVSIGSKISGTFNSAQIAKTSFDDGRITIIDSMNLSTGIGLVVLKTSDLINEGLKAHEIKSKIESIIPKVRSQFAIPTLDYLYKGGRCGTVSLLVGGVLAVKPIIQVRDGQMDVYKKAMGKMTRALDIMLDDFDAIKHEVDPSYVMIAHSIALKSLEYTRDGIKKRFKPNHLYETEAGCVISSHCGKGTVGLFYILK